VVNVSMNKLGPRLSLRKISAELAARGYTIGRGPKERAEGAPIGKPYAAAAIASMLAAA
jgi:hypothetical protein